MKKTNNKRFGGLPNKGTRVHKVRKSELLDKEHREEVEKALLEYFGPSDPSNQLAD